MILYYSKEGFMISKIEKGFSLVELLVVIAIIGILAAVGITAYSGYTKNAKAKASLSQFSQVEAVVNAELARCAVGEGDMIWGTAGFTPELDMDGGQPADVVYDADACADVASSWVDHTNLVSYINIGLPDSLEMKNPYNSDAHFATEAASFGQQNSVIGGLTVWCGSEGGKNQCKLEVMHKENPAVYETSLIQEY